MQLPTKCGLSAQYCLWLVFGDDFLIGSTNTDLLQLFGSITRIISELQHRFDGLPIHRIVYYQSYHQGVLQDLISASKLDPTGSNQHDCLGMTPLHILACSSVHDLEMYRLIVESTQKISLLKIDGGRCHYCTHSGRLHLVRLYNSFSKVINHSTLAMHSTGQ